MSIRPIDQNGMIQRTQDFSGLKQNQDNKPVVEQQTIQVQQAKHEQELARKVIRPEEKENKDYRYDAKDKGNGKYEGKGGKRKKKDGKEQEDGKVILKGHPSTFDMKI